MNARWNPGRLGLFAVPWLFFLYYAIVSDGIQRVVGIVWLLLIPFWVIRAMRANTRRGRDQRLEHDELSE